MQAANLTWKRMIELDPDLAGLVKWARQMRAMTGPRDRYLVFDSLKSWVRAKAGPQRYDGNPQLSTEAAHSLLISRVYSAIMGRR